MTRTILITGCSSGLGLDAARTLHARPGWRVLATARKPEDVARLSEEEGLEAFRLDVADPGSIAEGWDEAMRRTCGTLDALYNNAGFGLPALTEDLPTDALRDIFETNVFGLHELTRRAVAVMRAQGGHGRIVQHSSVLGRVSIRWRGAYNASKHAVEALADTLRLELRGTDIHISILNTGPIGTKFRVNSVPPFEKWIDWRASPRVTEYERELIPRLYHDSGRAPFELGPEAVTKKVIHAIESPRPKARYLVTVPSYIAETARRLLPQAAQDWLAAKT